MAFTKILVLFVGLFLLGIPASFGHPRPTRPAPDLTYTKLENLQAAVNSLEATVVIAYNHAKDAHCGNKKCESFLEGLGDLLCGSRLTPSNYTMAVSQIEAALKTSQLSLKLWNYVMEPVMEDLGPDYLGDENDTGLYTIPKAIHQVQRTIHSLNIHQPHYVSSTPRSLLLLRTFKDHLSTFKGHLSTFKGQVKSMVSASQAEAQ